MIKQVVSIAALRIKRVARSAKASVADRQARINGALNMSLCAEQLKDMGTCTMEEVYYMGDDDGLRLTYEEFMACSDHERQHLTNHGMFRAEHPKAGHRVIFINVVGESYTEDEFNALTVEHQQALTNLANIGIDFS